MAHNINQALETELNAALGVLEPQLRGLRDMEHDEISSDLKSALDSTIEARDRRKSLIDKVLESINQAQRDYDAMVADGYPDLPPVKIPESTFRELSGEVADTQAAASVFVAIPQATSISIGIGAPTEGIKAP